MIDGIRYNEVWLMDPDGSNRRQVYASSTQKLYITFDSSRGSLLFLETNNHGINICRIDMKGADPCVPQ